MQLADTYARLICPSQEIAAKQGKALFTLISSWAHAIMGTEKIIMGTILGTILCGFVRNMQADSGTKIPQLRGLMGCFAEGFGQIRKSRYFPMQKLANRRKAARLLGCSGSSLEHGHNLGHTFWSHAPNLPDHNPRTGCHAACYLRSAASLAVPS